MILIIIICSVLYILAIGLLYYLYVEYKQDYNNLEYRILYLEKRISECIKKENNTQEGSESNMPCGRKKGRGGRRK